MTLADAAAAAADEAAEAPTQVDSCIAAAEETPPLAVVPAPPVEPVEADGAKKDAGEEEDAGVVVAGKRENVAADASVEPASKAAKTADAAVEPASKAAKTAAAAAAEDAAEATAAKARARRRRRGR